jgi:hypothetical protein
MKVVISSHYDTVFTHPFGILRGGILTGACDNIAGIIAVAQNLPLMNMEGITWELTEDEEMYQDGARYIVKRNNPQDTFIIVVDCTLRNKRWEKTQFTIENIYGIKEYHIRRALSPLRGKYLIRKGFESEAWLYKDMGFACVEVDVPVMGGMHNLESKSRVEDMVVAGQAIKFLAEYVVKRERLNLGDPHTEDLKK